MFVSFLRSKMTSRFEKKEKAKKKHTNRKNNRKKNKTMWYPVTVHCASSASSSPLSPRLVPVRLSVSVRHPSFRKAQGDYANVLKSQHFFLNQNSQKISFEQIWLQCFNDEFRHKIFPTHSISWNGNWTKNKQTQRNSCTNLPSLVHSAGPQWSTVLVRGPQCWSTVRLGQQTVTYDSNPPAAKDPSAFFCPHLLSEPIQVHVCQSPHSPPPPVFCYYMWKTSKKLFCFF